MRDKVSVASVVSVPVLSTGFPIVSVCRDMPIFDATLVGQSLYPRAAAGQFRRQPYRLGRHEELETIMQLPSKDLGGLQWRQTRPQLSSDQGRLRCRR